MALPGTRTSKPPMPSEAEPSQTPSAEADPAPAPAPRPRRRTGDGAAIEDQKRAFLRLVSHELRTPLTSILGFSEIIAAELYGPLGAPQYKEYAEIIQGSGKKLLRLVNQVLEIGRLEGVELEVGAEAIEPALKLFKAAKLSNVGVIFITGRPADQRDATVINLEHAGFDGWTELRTRPLQDKRTVQQYKMEERIAVEKEPEGYTIIANIGDQISDIDGGHGGCTFKVPNPFYFIP